LLKPKSLGRVCRRVIVFPNVRPIEFKWALVMTSRI